MRVFSQGVERTQDHFCSQTACPSTPLTTGADIWGEGSPFVPACPSPPGCILHLKAFFIHFCKGSFSPS